MHVCFLQARAGVGSTVDVLRLFPSYVNETSYTVWENLVGNLSILDRLLSYTDCYDDFKRFAAKLFASTTVRLGWEPKDTECETNLVAGTGDTCVSLHAATLDGMLRSLVIGQFGHYGDIETIKEAQKRFTDYCSGGCSLPADLKAAVFSTSLANGDTSTFDQLVKVPTFLVNFTELHLCH